MTESSDYAALSRPRFEAVRALPWRRAMLAGIGATLTIAILAGTADLTALPLIIAPFGASCALVFGAPASPLAQPRNVICGHLVTAALGLLAFAFIASPVAAMAVGVGLGIAGMLLTGTLHPPAGANPIVVVMAAASWQFLFMPVAAGAIAIVLLGYIYHRVITGHDYDVLPKRSR